MSSGSAQRPRVSAIVLAGGRSRRFGSDKRRALFDGETLLDRTVRGAAAVGDEVVVVVGPADAPPDPPAGLATTYVVARDEVAGAGPLAGLIAGLEVAHGDLALVVGADMPWLDARVLRALLRAAARPGPVAWTLAGPDAVVQSLPLAGRRAPLAAAARELYAGGERSLRGLVVGANGGVVPAASWRRLDPDGRTIADVDHPSDLPPID